MLEGEKGTSLGGREGVLPGSLSPLLITGRLHSPIAGGWLALLACHSLPYQARSLSLGQSSL